MPAKAKAKRPPKPKYDCFKCPGYCCTYDEIQVTDFDLRRMAKGFGLTEAQVERRYTKKAADGSRIMRHRKDHIFESACVHFDTENRRCTIYEHRPKICRDFPGEPRCGYFDFMMWEREQQEDDDLIPIVELA
jgi:Fe-S-cluster containining protein